MTNSGTENGGTDNSGTGNSLAAVTLCAGSGSGELLALDEPLSFWGGTDRTTGMIIDAHHPQRGALLGGRVLLMDASRGSSSSSSVLAEQLRAGVGPRAIVLTARDAIVCLGVLAAAELYGNQIPVVLLAQADADRLRHEGASRSGASRSGESQSGTNHGGGPAIVSVTAQQDGSAAVVLSPESQDLPDGQDSPDVQNFPEPHT